VRSGVNRKLYLTAWVTVSVRQVTRNPSPIVGERDTIVSQALPFDRITDCTMVQMSRSLPVQDGSLAKAGDPTQTTRAAKMDR